MKGQKSNTSQNKTISEEQKKPENQKNGDSNSSSSSESSSSTSSSDRSGSSSSSGNSSSSGSSCRKNSEGITTDVNSNNGSMDIKNNRTKSSNDHTTTTTYYALTTERIQRSEICSMCKTNPAICYANKPKTTAVQSQSTNNKKRKVARVECKFHCNECLPKGNDHNMIQSSLIISEPSQRNLKTISPSVWNKALSLTMSEIFNDYVLDESIIKKAKKLIRHANSQDNAVDQSKFSYYLWELFNASSEKTSHIQGVPSTEVCIKESFVELFSKETIKKAKNRLSEKKIHD